MITSLAYPKTLTGRATVQQVAADRSWLVVRCDVKIILYGDSPRIVAACQELGIHYDFKVTELGIPYFGAIAVHAVEHASTA